MATMTNGRSSAARSRNMALFSMFAIIAGSYLTFRAQAPNGKVVSDADRKMMLGGDAAQPTPGRAPSRERTGSGTA